MYPRLAIVVRMRQKKGVWSNKIDSRGQHRGVNSIISRVNRVHTGPSDPEERENQTQGDSAVPNQMYPYLNGPRIRICCMISLATLERPRLSIATTVPVMYKPAGPKVDGLPCEKTASPIIASAP